MARLARTASLTAPWQQVGQARQDLEADVVGVGVLMCPDPFGHSVDAPGDDHGVERADRSLTFLADATTTIMVPGATLSI